MADEAGLEGCLATAGGDREELIRAIAYRRCHTRDYVGYALDDWLAGERRSIRALRRRRDRTRIDGFDQPSSHRAEERIERRPARPVALAVDSTLAIIGVVGFLFIPWLTQRVSSRLNAVTVFTTLLFWGWLWGVWGLSSWFRSS